MKLLVFILVLLFGSLAFGSAATVFITRDGAGTKDGSTLGNAGACDTSANTPQATCAFFNTAGNWGVGATQIGAGTVVHIGDDSVTITATTNSAGYLTCQGAGSVGNVIRVLISTTITTPAMSASGLVICNQQFVTWDGNNKAGIITSTTNGDCAGCTSTLQSRGFSIGASNAEIRNLQIGPMFQRSASDTSSNGNGSQGININPSDSNLDHFTIDGNNIQNAFEPMIITYGTTMTDLQIFNNTTDFSSHHIVVGDGNANHTLSGCNIYGNTLGPHFNIWQDVSQTMHADGIFVFAGNVGSVATCMIYNNTITGDMCSGSGGNCSAYIYMDGNHNSVVFNNIVKHTTNVSPGSEGALLNRATANTALNNKYYNNTFVGQSIENCLFNTGGGEGSGHVYENNIITSCKYLMGFGPLSTGVIPPSLSLSDFNVLNGQFTDVGITGVNGGTQTNYTSLATWRSNTGQDTHSVSGSPSLDANFVPQAGSSALNAGTNLNSACSGQANPGLGALCFDKNGVARPISGAWDAGAFQVSMASISQTINGVVQMSGSAVVK